MIVSSLKVKSIGSVLTFFPLVIDETVPWTDSFNSFNNSIFKSLSNLLNSPLVSDFV